MQNKYDGEERRVFPKESWHLSKSVPVSLLFAILLQTGVGFYFAGSMDQRVSNLEQHDVENSQVLTREESDKSHEMLQIQIDQNAETSKEIKESLKDIDGKLDRLIEREK